MGDTNALSSVGNNLLVLSVFFAMFLWVVRLCRRGVALSELSLALRQNHFVRLDGLGTAVRETELLSRSHFQQLLRERNRVAPVQMPCLYASFEVERDSLALSSAATARATGLATQPSGHHDDGDDDDTPTTPATPATPAGPFRVDGRVGISFAFSSTCACAVQVYYGVPYAHIARLHLREEADGAVGARDAPARLAKRGSREQLVGTGDSDEPAANPYAEGDGDGVGDGLAGDEAGRGGWGDVEAGDVPVHVIEPTHKVTDVLTRYAARGAVHTFAAGRALRMDESADALVDAALLRSGVRNVVPVAVVLRATSGTHITRSAGMWRSHTHVLLCDVRPHGSDGAVRVVPTSHLVLTPVGKREVMTVFGMEEASSECVVCLTEDKSVLLLPCRHLCVCGDCFKYIDKCPVCRTPFVSYVELQGKNDEADAGADTAGE